MKKFVMIPVAILWLFIFINQSCDQVKEPGEGYHGSGTSASFIDENFLGAENCQGCHEKEYKEWSTSHHKKSMAVATDSTVLGDFNNVKFVSKGTTTTFFKKEEKFFVKTIGPEGSLQDFEVVYTFGVTPLQQYLVKFPGGRYQTLHLTWNSESSRWFEQYPNDTFPTWDWLHWTNGAMTWNSMCADCHSTNLEKNYSDDDDTYKTTWSIINVSCEACHGPGRQHMEYIGSAEYDSINPVNGSFLKQTKNITPIEQIENCAPCHSRRSMISAKYDLKGRYLDHFIPEILREEVYYADGQIKEEDYVYGSFLQSKMFMNGVKCSNCHNVHSGDLLFTGNALCLQCHQKTKYDTPGHHFHLENTEQSKCVNCHMTGEFYMGNDFRRDHSFRVPRPDQSLYSNVPNACNRCHSDKDAKWAANAVNEWYGPERRMNYTDMLTLGSDDPNEFIKLINDITQPSIARATAVYRLDNFMSEAAYQTTVKSLSDRDARVKIEAINALVSLPSPDRVRLLSPLLNDPIRSVRISASNALADVDLNAVPLRFQSGFENAARENEIALRQNADFSSGQFQIGQYHDMRNEDSLAVKAYRKAILIDSLNGPARINLSRIYNKLGQNGLAIKTLNDLVLIDPENVDGYFYLGLVHAEEGNVNDARLAFEQAILLEPANPRFYYNLGLMLHKNGQRQKAEQVFLKGLKNVPNGDDIRYALATSYFESGKMEQALEQALILSESHPQNQNIQRLINEIRQATK